MTKAIIVSYRRGKNRQTPKQCLLSIEGADSLAKAAPFIGKKVSWETETGRHILGTITAAHGRNGVLRARFNKGLPGTALGAFAEIV